MYYQIGYDSYSATYLVDELASYGYSKGACLVPVIQGFKSLSQPMQKLEEDLKKQKNSLSKQFSNEMVFFQCRTCRGSKWKLYAKKE